MQIRVYAALREVMGGARFDVLLAQPTTVGVVLAELADQHPALAPKLWDENGELKSGYVMALLNGRSIAFLQGLATPICDDDILSLFPPVGGG